MRNKKLKHTKFKENDNSVHKANYRKAIRILYVLFLFQLVWHKVSFLTVVPGDLEVEVEVEACVLLCTHFVLYNVQPTTQIGTDVKYVTVKITEVSVL